MKLPLTPLEQVALKLSAHQEWDGQWPRIVKVVLVHSYGPQNNDKVKEPANEVAVLP